MEKTPLKDIIILILVIAILALGSFILIIYATSSALLRDMPFYLAEWSLLLSLLNQFNFLFCHGLILIMIPGGVLMILTTNFLNKNKYPIAKILLFMSITTLAGYLIPINLGTLAYVYGSVIMAPNLLLNFIYYCVEMVLLIITLALIPRIEEKKEKKG